jgi:alpha-D-ribose 1-methylphosphonate 5-triphosphate diphosphatase
MSDLILSNASILTPAGIVEGSIVCEDGLVASVGGDQRGHDLPGALVVPGLIDLHNDGLEAEVNPRPGTGLPIEFALQNFDRRAAGAGITLALHAITFADMSPKGREVSRASDYAQAIRRLQPDETIAEHGVLFRADVWQPHGLDLLFERAREWPLPVATLNDHTPGQGQYRDVTFFRNWLVERAGDDEAKANARIAELMGRASEHPELADETFRRMAEAVRDGGLLLGSHDDDTAERCEMMHSLGATIAEFPVTIEAAQRARELGMTIVAGAPNVVRGGSHNDNVSAAGLVRAGLCDVLVADYHAPSLLLAVQRLVEEHSLPMDRAFALITTNPARAIRRDDLGSLEPGRRATMTVLRVANGGPWRTIGLIRDGRWRARYDAAHEPALALAAS